MFIELFSFSRSLANIVKAFDNTNNQQCMTQPTLNNSYFKECIQGLRYYPFAVNLDTYMGICNTFNDLSKRVCVPNKT